MFQNVDRIWPNRIWPIWVFWPNFLLFFVVIVFVVVCFWLLLWFLVVACCCLLVFKTLDRPKFRSFFSLSCRKFHSFFSLWEDFSLNFGGVSEDRDAQMCAFGVLGLSCASPGGPVWWGRRGSTQQPESPKPFGPHLFWVRAPPTLRAPTPSGPHPSGPHPSGPHPFGPPPLRAPTPPGPHPRAPTKTKLAKCGLAKFGQEKLAKFGQIRMAKCGQLTLAKCGIGQIRFGQIRPNKDGQNRFGQMRSRPNSSLSTFNRPSCGASPAFGRRCST